MDNAVSRVASRLKTVHLVWMMLWDVEKSDYLVLSRQISVSPLMLLTGCMYYSHTPVNRPVDSQKVHHQGHFLFGLKIGGRVRSMSSVWPQNRHMPRFVCSTSEVKLRRCWLVVCCLVYSPGQRAVTTSTTPFYLFNWFWLIVWTVWFSDFPCWSTKISTII